MHKQKSYRRACWPTQVKFRRDFTQLSTLICQVALLRVAFEPTKIVSAVRLAAPGGLTLGFCPIFLVLYLKYFRLLGPRVKFPHFSSCPSNWFLHPPDADSYLAQYTVHNRVIVLEVTILAQGSTYKSCLRPCPQLLCPCACHWTWSSRKFSRTLHSAIMWCRPVTSAPVECVCSTSGLFTRPQCARTGNKLANVAYWW